jgi:hypothetical protein
MIEKQLTALQKLDNLSYQKKLEQFPNLPEKAIPRTKYKDGSANDLTKCVIDFLRMKGHYATRIQSQGQKRGNVMTYGTTQRGTADIHSIVNSIHISCEIKYGKDKQSDAQKIVQQEVEQSGGVYLLIRDFEQFYKFYCEFMNLPY